MPTPGFCGHAGNAPHLKATEMPLDPCKSRAGRGEQGPPALSWARSPTMGMGWSGVQRNCLSHPCRCRQLPLPTRCPQAQPAPFLQHRGFRGCPNSRGYGMAEEPQCWELFWFYLCFLQGRRSCSLRHTWRALSSSVQCSELLGALGRVEASGQMALIAGMGSK